MFPQTQRADIIWLLGLTTTSQYGAIIGPAPSVQRPDSGPGLTDMLWDIKLTHWSRDKAVPFAGDIFKLVFMYGKRILI